jgi:hypothetical protein
MTYSAGSTILAADYNGFAGGNLGANVSGELNTVWGGGNRSAGYGQNRVSNVTAVTDLVTATQWTTFINTLNAVRKHQDGVAFTNIGTVTAGATINANVLFSTNLTTAYTNRFGFGAGAGTTTTGSTYSPNFTAVANTSAVTFNITRTATFASADQARYFFNAGGQLNFVVISVTNGDGTNRSGSLVTLANTNFKSCKVLGGNSSGRTGTSGTLNANSTTSGYYAATTSNANIVSITSTTAAYTNDQLGFSYKTNGAQGSYADNGTTMNLNLVLFSGAQSPSYADDTINITVNHRVDVIYPETTFLSNTWGSVTIS